MCLSRAAGRVIEQAAALAGAAAAAVLMMGHRDAPRGMCASSMKYNMGIALTKRACAVAIAMLSLCVACAAPPPADTATPPGWSRVEIERTYSIALPPGVEQVPYGHPEGSVVLFKSSRFHLHIALLHAPVGEVQPVEDLNARIDGRQVHIGRLPHNTGFPELPVGFVATFGDIGDESTFIMLSAYCKDVATYEAVEKIVRSMRFLPVRPRRSLPPIPDPPGR